MNDLIQATLVWDGKDLHIPPQMLPDVPLPASLIAEKGQLLGTDVEKVCELAGRNCYDSLGLGRPTSEYFDHIHQVGHYSIMEHTVFTLAFDVPGRLAFATMRWLANRPGLHVESEGTNLNAPVGFRLTLNLRTALEWDDRCPPMAGGLLIDEVHLPVALWYWVAHSAHDIAPNICEAPKVEDAGPAIEGGGTPITNARMVEPNNDHERWVTMFCAGSRGFSHELVRHGDSTAISQRSTRYVDEDGSPWVHHPLIDAYIAENDGVLIPNGMSAAKDYAQSVYGDIAKHLQAWLMNSRGVDKFTARKQARGAARGFLGNALHTELIFSASVAEWKHILHMRASDAADAEIREWGVKALGELKRSRYADCFDGYDLRESSDKLGQSLVDAAHT